MTKIHITGNAGAGKTTLAYKIGAALDLPVFGLDKIVWQPGWKKSDPTWRADQEHALASRSNWVIDGVSEPIRQAADVVIFLDVGRQTALLRCAKRNWKYLFRSRPELPDHCPELLIIPKLVQIILRFNNAMRPAILADLSQRPSSSYHVRTQVELEEALSHLGIDPETWTKKPSKSTAA